MFPVTRDGLRSMCIGGAIVVCVWAALAGGTRGVAAQDDVAVELNEYERSGVSGEATISPEGEGVAVSMQLTGASLTGNHPTHIHTGTCDNFDPNPIFPLTTVVLEDVNTRGMSESTVPDVTLDELLEDDYVILVHKSPEELTDYLVCGEITRGAVDVPSAGTGAMVSGAAGSFGLPLVITGVAALSAVAAAGLWISGTRRPRP